MLKQGKGIRIVDVRQRDGTVKPDFEVFDLDEIETVQSRNGIEVPQPIGVPN
jgi:hypothetical protein